MDNNFYYTFNGFLIHDLSEAPKDAIIIAHSRLLGGKGGFGSMLRAIGSQIEKTTNHEMCRDLSGRRMRDVNNEKKFKEWLEKADDRERSRVEVYLEKRRKRKILLEQGPSATVPFEERTTNEKRQQILNELQDAIDEAFERRSRMANVTKVPVKAKNFNMGVDSDLDSSSNSDCASPLRNECNTEYKQCQDDQDFEPAKKMAKIDEKCESKEMNFTEGVEKMKEEIKYAEGRVDEINDIKEKEEEMKGIEEKEKDIKDVEENEEEINYLEEKVQGIKDAEEKQENISITKERKTEAKNEVQYTEIDLEKCDSVDNLLIYDLDWIKYELMRRGLKCGGTLMERAQRLFLCKGLAPDMYPVSILAGSNNRRRK